MKILRSVRSRLLVASIFWTLGLLGLTHLLFLTILRHLSIRHMSIYVHPAIIVFTVAMAIGLMVGGTAVRPLTRLRAKMIALRDGSIARVDGEYPTEVQPLVDDLNALLEHREEAVRRALAKAGDLAHGLKTPLAVLGHEADRAEAEGQREIAAAIRQQVERMRRQIEVNLAQARAAGSGATPGTRTSIASAAESLARTLSRLYAERHLAIEVDVPADDFVRCEREDLEEMLGNLLDNACKWAASRVRISAQTTNGSTAIAIDDDGAGLDDSMCETVIQRGIRADEAAPGSGLGLAIVRDIADVYGGGIRLSRSPLGGLRAELRLPAA